jgi:glycosyltransferase involved in cell wall biosynthesis
VKAAAIVPAYNEATRIEKVLQVLMQCPLLHEVLVVNDGSTDNTAKVAAQQAHTLHAPMLRVINLPVNRGKGGAMFAGATATDADVIIFLDADLIGLKPEHVARILRPVLEGDAAMSIGVFRGGRFSTDIAQVLVPYISGQRAMLRDLFIEIPGIECTRSGVEIALTLHFRRQRYPVSMVVMEGVTHTMKEEKLGWARGVRARAKMYAEIARAFMRYTRLSDLRHRLLLKREE